MKCLRKPVFVLACNQGFFGGLEGAIHSLDIHWPTHQIVFYDMGLTPQQRELVKKKQMISSHSQKSFSFI